MFQRCRIMLDAANSVLTISGQGSSEPEGTISVSVPKAVGHFVLHPHMPAFLQRYPQVDVHLRLEDRYMDLIRRFGSIWHYASPTARHRA